MSTKHTPLRSSACLAYSSPIQRRMISPWTSPLRWPHADVAAPPAGAGAVGADGGLGAWARDPLEAADAHVQLGRPPADAEEDLAGARLHCEAALRLAPDLPAALYQLADLCHRSGEHLRAIK